MLKLVCDDYELILTALAHLYHTLDTDKRAKLLCHDIPMLKHEALDKVRRLETKIKEHLPNG
jgi:hypothetical protein